MSRVLFALVTASLLLGCELFAPGAIPCATDSDCLDGYACIDETHCVRSSPRDAGEPRDDAGDPPVFDAGPKIVVGGLRADAGAPEDAGLVEDAGIRDAGVDAGIDDCSPALLIVVEPGGCEDLQRALDNVLPSGRVELRMDVSGAFTIPKSGVTLEGIGSVRPRITALGGDALTLEQPGQTVRFVELVTRPGVQGLVVTAAADGALVHRNTFSGVPPTTALGEGTGISVLGETRVIANHFWGWLNPAISVDSGSNSQLLHNTSFLFPPVAHVLAAGGAPNLVISHNVFFGINPAPTAPAISGLGDCGSDNVNNRARGDCNDAPGPTENNIGAFLTTLNGPCLSQVSTGGASTVNSQGPLEDHSGALFADGTTVIGALTATCQNAAPRGLQERVDAVTFDGTVTVTADHDGPLAIGRPVTVEDPTGQARVRVDTQTAISVFYTSSATVRGLVVERTGDLSGRAVTAESAAPNAQLVVDRLLVRDPAREAVAAIDAAVFVRRMTLVLKNSAIAGPFDAFIDLEDGPNRAFISGNSFHSPSAGRVLYSQNNSTRFRCNIISTPDATSIADFDIDGLSRGNVFLDVTGGDVPSQNTNCLADEIGDGGDCPPSRDIFIDPANGDLRRAFIANLEDNDQCQIGAQTSLADGDTDRGGCARTERFSVGAYEYDAPDAGTCDP